METSGCSRRERRALGLPCTPVKVTDGDKKGQCLVGGRMLAGGVTRMLFGVESVCFSMLGWARQTVPRDETRCPITDRELVPHPASTFSPRLVSLAPPSPALPKAPTQTTAGCRGTELRVGFWSPPVL